MKPKHAFQHIPLTLLAIPLLLPGPAARAEDQDPHGKAAGIAGNGGAQEATGNARRAETPATEPERLAESEVNEVTREVQRELDQRKARIEGPEEAQALFAEILGAESRISRAELAREEQYRPRNDGLT